jgi:RNA polymerase sigma-70 factor (ECF subfamily)
MLFPQVRELFSYFRHYSYRWQTKEIANQCRVNMTSDEVLILEFQRGSRAAFDELFGRYQGPLYGFFRRRLQSQDRAEDLVQETFLAVIRATWRYQPRSLVRTYLYGIALKVLAGERRKQSKDPPAPESTPEPAGDDASDTVLWVRQAIAKLDAIDREIVMLREYEQLSYVEIAQLLRIPVNTVRSRLFRARKALKESLQPEEKPQATVVDISQAGGINASPAGSEA